MVKKTGKKVQSNYILFSQIVLICNLFLIIYNVKASEDPKIKLTALTMQNYVLESIAQGLPFSIEVGIEGDKEVSLKPDLPGINQLQVLQVVPTYSQITESGKTKYEQRYLYVVRAQHAGNFKIGPAKLIINGKEIKSKEIDIKVTPAKKEDINFIPKEPIYELIIKRKNVYLGEKITFKLIFKFDNSKSIRLQAIQDPEMAGIKGIKLKGPKSQEELIDENIFQTLEWEGEFFPASSGVLSIPPLKATYRIGFQLYEVFSKPIKIEVKELPPYDKRVDAIGKFKKLEIFLEKDKIFTDQAAILKLKVQGEGDLESIIAPKLELSPFLRYYPGIKKIEGNNVVFEYVIQAEKADTYKIPSQLFNFFDIEKKKYITLKSNELTLSVEQAPQLNLNGESKVEADTSKINEELVVNKSKFSEIPDIIFILLLIISILLLIINQLYFYLLKNDFFNKLKSKMAFNKAILLLRKAEQKKDISNIDKILKKAIIVKFNLPADITHYELEQLLVRYGFTPQMIKDWNLYINQINAPLYDKLGNKVSISDLFKQTYYWINILKRLNK